MPIIIIIIMIIIIIIPKRKMPSALDNLIGRTLQSVPHLGQGDKVIINRLVKYLLGVIEA